ncbi:hypothetical protein [Bdellovibrio sp. HCB337]|uniref:hypothetical protein n=1 Tax=Bdellovibrio sp. HCB337 TaxID=3394358 RepID=UPI0039A75383
MKLKIFFATISLVTMACSSSFKNQSRGVAETASEAREEACMLNFNKARQRLADLVGARPNEFPAVFNRELLASFKSARYACVSETVPEYGIKVIPLGSEKQIVIEATLVSVAGLTESEVGRAGFTKYKINVNTVYLDRVLVALAAHAYAEVLGVQDASYDMFFKTLKMLEQN